MADAPNPFAQFGPATPVPTASASPVNPFAQFGPASSTIGSPPSSGRPSLETGLARGAELGAMSDWDRAAEALARGAGDVAHLVGDKNWMPGASLTAKDVAAEKAFRQEYSNQPGFGVGDVAGSIAGTLPTAAVGGGVAGPVGLAARALGVMGAGAETGSPGARGATEGAAIGLGTMGAGAGAARVVNKYVRPEAQRLMAAGVRLTPGQMKGGFLDDAEQKISGTVPLTGEVIKRARAQSIHDFNTATMNKVLSSIGDKITGPEKFGNSAVKETGDKLSNAYNAILNNPDLKFVAGPQFAKDVDDINDEAKLLPTDTMNTFNKIIEHALNPKITGLPSGQQLKSALSTLDVEARDYASSPLPAERKMAALLRDYQTALKDNLATTNPGVARQLKTLDNAWAQLVRVENAAGRRATSGGVFTPADLLAAERGSANSVRKRSFARGQGLLQDWANDAQKVLPSKLPDTQTTGRLLMESTLAGGAGLFAGHEVPQYAIPAAVAMGVGALPYTGPGISAANAVADPAIRAAIAQALGTSGRYIAAPISSLVANQGQ
jgi:hypothetical protein